jgi:AcrR family transcriptional regulator
MTSLAAETRENVNAMSEVRPQRADAQRNRRRLLDAATAVFCERGLDVSVGDIAHRAGVGRATLFRNFPTKDHLIVAIVVDRFSEAVARGRALLDAPDAGEALFALIDESVGRQRTDRTLFDALDDVWLSHPEIHEAHSQLIATLDALLVRAQLAGAVREDVSAVDVLMLLKGVCEAGSSFQNVDPEIALRQLDLVRAAISTPDHQRRLRGRRPTIEDLNWPDPAAPAAAQSTAAQGVTAEGITGEGVTGEGVTA